MLLSLSLILMIGFALSGIFNKLNLPGLLGMMLTGIILGPYALNLLDPSILEIAPDLREIALIVILTRAGLSIDIKDLKKVGRPALLMCFLPATFEIIAITFLAPLFLNFSYLEALLLGTILAAVSPAVIVPRMIHLMELGYGKAKSIPQLIMAGASIDDIYVILLFTIMMGIHTGASLNPQSLLRLPISILLGILVGILLGFILNHLFKNIHMRDTIKVLLLLAISFSVVSIEDLMITSIPFSGLLSVMAMSATLLKLNESLAKRLKGKFSKVWVGAELLLFVLVGAAVDISYLPKAGIGAFILLFLALIIRTFGVLLSLVNTPLNKKERIFCALSYMPKATVQAAIGAIPLAAGIPAGPMILTVAVLAIILTAPLGAIAIDKTYQSLLR